MLSKVWLLCITVNVFWEVEGLAIHLKSFTFLALAEPQLVGWGTILAPLLHSCTLCAYIRSPY